MGSSRPIRIDRDTVPEGWFVYDLWDGDDGFFGGLRNGYVRIYHAGAFATKTDLGLMDGEELLFIGNEDSYVRPLDDDEFDYSFV